MKKYRLIEYDPTFSKEYHPTIKSEWTGLPNVYAHLQDEQTLHPYFYYRIEEVEESIMDRVKSYKDAYKECCNHGWAQEITICDSVPIWIKPYSDLCIITAALNEGWKPDWEDERQEKWGVQLDSRTNTAYTLCKYYVSNTPSRLYFKSKELAEYAAKQFAGLYKQLLIEKF